MERPTSKIFRYAPTATQLSKPKYSMTQRIPTTAKRSAKRFFRYLPGKLSRTQPLRAGKSTNIKYQWSMVLSNIGTYICHTICKQLNTQQRSKLRNYSANYVQVIPQLPTKCLLSNNRLKVGTFSRECQQEQVLQPSCLALHRSTNN